jgi:hypothetical protein
VDDEIELSQAITALRSAIDNHPQGPGILTADETVGVPHISPDVAFTARRLVNGWVSLTAGSAIHEAFLREFSLYFTWGPDP